MTPTITHINDLVDRCRLGDQRAQMEIYERYYKAMYNTAFRITGRTAEAEDIMQEAFLSAFTRINSFKGNSTFGAWLKRIVVNESITAYKKFVKLGEVSYHDKLKNEEHDPGASLHTDEKKNARVRRVLEQIKSLKENYRLGLTLHLIEGYDYEEICEIMNISYANCRTMISRAKDSLKKNYNAMKDSEFKNIFEDLDFNIEEPNLGHRERFFHKLEHRDKLPEKTRKIRQLWAPVLGIAASLVLAFFLFAEFLIPLNSANHELASISPEMKQTQEFYSGLISRELNALNEEKTPETKAIINDAMEQLEILELDYAHLEKDLIESGKDNRVIHAMIQNFQQRIDLLNNVLTQIENNKSLKNQNYENNII